LPFSIIWTSWIKVPNNTWRVVEKQGDLYREVRRKARGSSKRYVYTYPSKKAVMAIKAKVRTLTHRSSWPTLSVLLHRLNPALRGWAAYFQHGERTFSYLGQFAWTRIVGWLRKQYPRTGWAKLRRRYLPGWRPTQDGIELFNPATVTVTRYRYRGNKIPNPWTAIPSTT
jgi:RNA-directed DNA polymerase